MTLMQRNQINLIRGLSVYNTLPFLCKIIIWQSPILYDVKLFHNLTAQSTEGK